MQISLRSGFVEITFLLQLPAESISRLRNPLVRPFVDRPFVRSLINRIPGRWNDRYLRRWKRRGMSYERFPALENTAVLLVNDKTVRWSQL